MPHASDLVDKRIVHLTSLLRLFIHSGSAPLICNAFVMASHVCVIRPAFDFPPFHRSYFGSA